MVDDIIEKRRSIRKYTNKEIKNEIIAELIDAANHAPSSGGLQGRYFILVRDLDKKKKIAKYSLEQDWMADANVIVVLCSDDVKIKKYYKERGENLYSIQNCALAAENLLLKATSLGLGSCFVSAFDEEEIKDLLKIPEGFRPQSIITLGYPGEVPEEKKLSSIKNLVYFEEWGEKLAFKIPKKEKIETVKKSFLNKIKNKFNV